MIDVTTVWLMLLVGLSAAIGAAGSVLVAVRLLDSRLRSLKSELAKSHDALGTRGIFLAERLNDIEARIGAVAAQVAAIDAPRIDRS